MDIKEIKKLAEMARVNMSDEEIDSMAKDFDPILAYVGHVKEALELNKGNSLDEKGENSLCNVTREDIVSNKSGEYTEKILEQFPDSQDGYLKVKQIL